MMAEVSTPEEQLTSEDLKKYFKRKAIYPPEMFPDLFSEIDPTLALTYLWRGTSIKELPVLLKENFAHLGPDSTVWVDIMFNDQRNDIAVGIAVHNANQIYMNAANHAVIFSLGDYPVFDASGVETGVFQKCLAWDRCWCVHEMAIRDCLAVGLRKKKPSRYILLSNHSKEILQHIDALGDHVDFFQNMQGMPDDVKEIQKNLLSEGFFETKEAFNARFLEKLKVLSRMFGR
jgi:hypothetical protein